MLMILLSALESDEDRQKFIALYEEHHARMERTAMRILKEQCDAEDAVQNAFVQIIRHFDTACSLPCEKLPFWIITIVKNEARLILRRERKTVPLEDWDDFAESAEDVLRYRELVALFAQLPESYRMVLEWKLLLGCSDQEIAKRMGLSKTAVSTRASRGRALLREIIGREGFTYDGAGTGRTAAACPAGRGEA